MGGTYECLVRQTTHTTPPAGEVAVDGYDHTCLIMEFHTVDHTHTHTRRCFMKLSNEVGRFRSE